ncbi:F0F1 ATP synthase subunit epsilon [Leucobacter sp. OH2974_COT-288]|uniref:F-type H+-transporting ATPase subunit epsilon n=1 Tax=Canibacter oris TaxID=1365628 RepID=A0A840DK84_9MICO|nr:F0F1 ATP synthase subunit epsilon [Canibacter oris]MBB4072125.1 F-type H+-transporting ATPase subunit epsilon [Canibacter oris]RRD36601.1 F0F1 ATP synthase subunit epsilon [Leucobacter sp. OH2974_COT-288]
MALLNVCVVSADRKIWAGEAKQVTAKTSEGEIGILAGHEPLLALLAEGEVRVTTPDNQKIIVNAEGGFFSVDHNEVQVVAGQATLVA